MDVKIIRNRSKLPGVVITFKQHFVTICLMFLFIAGLITGTLMIRFQNPVSTLIVSLFQRYNGLIVSSTFINNFLNLFVCNLFFVLILFFLGFTALGCPFVCIISLMKGVGIGIVSSFLYSQYKLSGFGYCMLIFYPQQILNMLALIIAMNESFVNSKALYNTICNSTQSSFDIKIYSVRYVFATLITLLSCFLGAVLNTFLSPMIIK